MDTHRIIQNPLDLGVTPRFIILQEGVDIMDISLEKESVGKLFVKFSVPTVIAMIVFSLYIVVDGIFVGNVVGSSGLAAVNIAMPFFSVAMSLGTMVAIGGSTITGVELGKNLPQQAKKTFSLAFYLLLAITFTMAIFAIVLAPLLAKLLGANDTLLPLVVTYIRSLCIFLPTFVGGSFLSSGLRVMGKPNYAMICDVTSAVLNIILDYIFIVKFNMGLMGAGLASGLAFSIGFMLALVPYFKTTSILKFVKTTIDYKKIGKILYNGSSEAITQFALAFSNYIFNIVLMIKIGEMGVSAFSIILYVASLVIAIFMGICTGISPVISYNHGAKLEVRIRKLMKLAFTTITLLGISSSLLMILGGETLISMFTTGDPALIEFTASASRIYSLCFIFNGINILGSAYFTAIEDAKTSAIISFLRGAVLIVVFIIILPLALGDVGIWLTVPLSEMTTIIFTFKLIKKSKENLALEYSKTL